jgi:hypothetical protein
MEKTVHVAVRRNELFYIKRALQKAYVSCIINSTLKIEKIVVSTSLHIMNLTCGRSVWKGSLKQRRVS